jgi:hypothetical protein
LEIETYREEYYIGGNLIYKIERPQKIDSFSKTILEEIKS